MSKSQKLYFSRENVFSSSRFSEFTIFWTRWNLQSRVSELSRGMKEMCVFLCNPISVSLTLWTFDFLASKVNKCGSCCLYFWTTSLCKASEPLFEGETLGESQDKYRSNIVMLGCLWRSESGQSHHLYAPAPFRLCVKGLSRFFQPGTNPQLQSAACRLLLLIQSCTVS